MPDKDTPYKLDFDDDTRGAVEREICNRVREAVEGAEQRNSDLQTWHDQLYGFGVQSGNQAWANGCNLASPMSEKAFLTLLSQIVGASHRDPMVATEAFSADDEENAKIIESWLSMEASRSDIPSHIYNFAHAACWAPAVVGYVGWVQETKINREVGYRIKGEGRIYDEEERDDEQEYEEIPVAEEVTEERFDIRAVPLRDFFLYPPNAKSVERATSVAERMSLTADELLDGVDIYGYDEEAVEELISLGSASRTTDQEDMDDQNGLSDAPGKDGYFEVFTVYTRMPRLEDYDIPTELRRDDFLVVCCPEANIVLKMAFSPFKERPYFVGGIMPDPDNYFGRGLMAMLNGLQSEANGNVQFGIDSANLTMAPCLMGPKLSDDDIGKIVIEPGKYIGLNEYDRIKPVEWDRAPLRDMLATDQWLNNQADALVSAQGQGALSGKVRKQAEIDNLQAQTSAKFGMYLSNFQRTVVAEVFRRMVALKLEFGDVDEDGEDFVDSEGHASKLTARALKGKYNIVAAGTSLTHSPEAQVEVNKHKIEVQAGYLKAKQAGAPPSDLKLIWHGAREMLFSLGERNPEAWIGDEPEDKPQMPPPDMQKPPMGIPMGQPGMNGTGQMPQMPMMSEGAA